MQTGAVTLAIRTTPILPTRIETNVSGADEVEKRHRRWEALVPGLMKSQSAQLEDLLDEIMRWNRRIRLTSDADRETLALRLVDDSLLLAPHLKGASLLDVGSGPGIPALPLSIALPHLDVRTVEPIAKKVAFTRAFLSRHPDLRVRPYIGRVEPGVQGPWGVADSVVSRAFTAAERWIELGSLLVKPGGRLLVTTGIEPVGDARERIEEVAREQGLLPAGQWSGKLGDVTRSILLFDKVMQSD